MVSKIHQRCLLLSFFVVLSSTVASCHQRASPQLAGLQDGDVRWQLVGGLGANSSWDGDRLDANQVRALVLYRDEVYAGLVSDAFSNGTVWAFNGTAWRQVAGDGVNQSWPAGSKRGVYSLVVYGPYLYAGLGDFPGDAEVWRFDGVGWMQVGGDGLLSSWPGSIHDAVWSLGVYQGSLYAGLMTERAGTNKALLYRFDGTTWSFVTGENGELGGWRSSGGYIMTYVMATSGSFLFVGLAGRAAGTAEVWRFDGTSFTQIGGDGLNQSWSDGEIRYVEDLLAHDDQLYASLQRPAATAETESSIWKYDGSAWRAVGNSIPAEWTDLTIFNKLLVYRNRIHVAAGGANHAASVWQLQDDTSWRKIGGAGLDGSSWHHRISSEDSGDYPLWVYSMLEYQDHLLIGFASSAVAGRGQVWQYW